MIVTPGRPVRINDHLAGRGRRFDRPCRPEPGQPEAFFPKFRSKDIMQRVLRLWGENLRGIGSCMSKRPSGWSTEKLTSSWGFPRTARREVGNSDFVMAGKCVYSGGVQAELDARQAGPIVDGDVVPFGLAVAGPKPIGKRLVGRVDRMNESFSLRVVRTNATVVTCPWGFRRKSSRLFPQPAGERCLQPDRLSPRNGKIAGGRLDLRQADGAGSAPQNRFTKTQARAGRSGTARRSRRVPPPGAIRVCGAGEREPPARHRHDGSFDRFGDDPANRTFDPVIDSGIVRLIESLMVSHRSSRSGN